MAALPDTRSAAPEAREQRSRTRYDAFISYSHAADGRLAPALQAGLHRFAKPWYRLRALRVFRDEASLSANPALWGSITQALDGAQAFILLASPDAKASQWVAREASWWRERKPVERLLILLTEGEIAWDDHAGDFDWGRTDALPETLAGAFSEEPRWIDLRWARDAVDVSLRNPRFRNAVAEVAAPLHGRGKDELIGEDVRQHRRAMLLARAAVASLAMLMLAVAGVAVLALDQRNAARGERDRAEQQARIATSRLLANQAVTDFDRSADRGALLALEAFRTAPTFEARAALVRAVQRTQRAPVVLRGHDGEALGVEFSRDGRRLLTTGGDESVRVWDVDANRQVGEPMSCYCLTTTSGARFMPDGQRVVSAYGFDSTSLTFWSLRTRRPLREATDDAGSIEGLAVSRDGRLLATFGEGRPVVVWDAVRARPLGPLPGTGGDSTWGAGFSPDGRLLAVDHATRGLELWDVARRRPVAALAPAGNWNRAFAFAPDGKTIAFKGDEGIRLWDVTARAFRGHPIGFHAVVFGLAFDPRGRLLAAAAEGGIVRIWDTVTGRALGGALTGHENRVNDVAFSPDGGTLASAGQDGTVRLWSIAAQPLGVPVVAQATMLAADPSGGLVAVGASEGPIRLFRQTNWSLDRNIADDTSTREAAFAPGGRLVALGDESGAVTIWDTASGRRVGPVLGDRGAGRITSVAFSHDGRLLAAIGESEWLRVWRVGSWKLVDKPQVGDEGNLDGVTPGLDEAFFLPEGTLVTAGRTGVALWRIADDRISRPELIDVDVSLDTAALSPDGRTLALGTGEDSRVRLLDLRTRAQGEPLAGHAEGVDSLAFSTDGRVLASGSAFDETIRLWDSASGRPLTDALRSDAGTVVDLAFSPTGDLLVSAQAGALVAWDPILWRGRLADFRDRLCPAAGRNLTRGEWARFLPGRPYARTCPGE